MAQEASPKWVFNIFSSLVGHVYNSLGERVFGQNNGARRACPSEQPLEVWLPRPIIYTQYFEAPVN